MLHANLVSVFLQLQNSGGEAARASAPQASQSFPQLTVGQAVTAAIVSRLSANLYLADIAGHQLQLNLPPTVVPGESLSLRLLRMEPQPVFELLSHAPAPAPLPATAAPPSQGRQVIEAVFVDAQPGRAPASPSSPSPAQLSLGQTVTATVLARIGPNLVLADIDGQRLHLALPATVSTGAPVLLRLLRLEPQPAFELLSHASPAPNALAALSQGAQIIQTVLADARGTQSGPPVPLSSSAPLLAAAPSQGPPAESERLAVALRNAIAGSGVFYESHLVAWAQGRRMLAELQREPQAGWRAPAADAAANQASPASGDTPRTPAPSSGDAARSAAAALPEEALPVLRQQIDALENNRLTWQGPVWPNQNASLTIAEEEPRPGEEAAPPPWRTSLALTLPRLGDIRAELVARGPTLSISIACGDSDTARVLDSELQRLDAGLRAAGLDPLTLMVTSHD